MSRFNSNEPIPSIAPVQSPKPPKDNNKWIIGGLSAAILLLGGYLVYDKVHTANELRSQQEQIATTSAEKSNVQTSFDASLARLDSLSGANNGMNSQLKAKNDEIASMKEEIRGILNKQNATSDELARAKSLITKLNSKIAGLQQEIATLRKDNRMLNDSLVVSNSARVVLQEKVDIGSTLNASNITVTPVNVKGNGKEKVSTNARKVDKMVVSFDVSNRIAQAGTTDLYVIVVGPDGQQVRGSGEMGEFNTRDAGSKTFTAKVPVELESGVKRKVAFSFIPQGNNFQKGNYIIQIYQNGFLIGEGSQSLKRGLFG